MTMSTSKRVTMYVLPVVVLSVAVNVPKFLETRVVIERTHDPDTGQNVTNYSFDVTELRSVGGHYVPGSSEKRLTGNRGKLTYSPAVGCNWLCLAGV